MAAFSAALAENTRDRAPLDWARDFGNQGWALVLRADRTADVAMARTGLEQIEAALNASSSGGHAANTTIFQNLMRRAGALVDRLGAGRPT